MNTMNTTALQLRNKWLVRPSSALGTCGSHPFPWDAGVGSTPEKALNCFINNNSRHLKGVTIVNTIEH